MRKKKLLALMVILCMAVSLLAVFAACDDASVLDTPTGFTLNKTTLMLSWSPVEHAYSYDFYVMDEDGVRSNVNNIPARKDDDGNVITPSQSLAGITNSGTYTIYVQALADPSEVDVSGNPVYGDSQVATYTYVRGDKYGNPQGVSAVYEAVEPGSDNMGLRVSFSAVEGAASYTVQVLRSGSVLTDVTTVSTTQWIETYIETSSDGTETTRRYEDNPTTYTVQVRANAADGSSNINSDWSRASVIVTSELTNPRITEIAISNESTHRLRWTSVSNASKIVVEAWKIDGSGYASALELFKNIEAYAAENEPDYSYSPSSGSATSCTLSTLNIDEAGEYLITVRAEGDSAGVYLPTQRVNTVTSAEADEESDIYTVTVNESPVESTMPAESGSAQINACLENVNNGIADTVAIYFDAAALDGVNMFKIILSSVNTSSANSLSDITASVRVEYDNDEDKLVIRDGSDSYGAAVLEELGTGYKLTYSLDNIFHSSGDNGEITHNQSSRNVYGRYFNIKVQACYYESHTYRPSDEADTAVTARLQSNSLTLTNASYLSVCEPDSYEEATKKTYTIRTSYMTEDGEETGEIYSPARAQLMYIQKLMLQGNDCLGLTFVIAEDIDFDGNAWLALSNTSFKGTIKSAEIAYSENATRSGEYVISNLTVMNEALLEYSRTEEHSAQTVTFTQNYAMFPTFEGVLRHVNFLHITAEDTEYAYTVTGEAEEGEEAQEEEKIQRVSTSAVIAGVNKGTIEYVYVSGTFKGVNTSGVIAAVNSGRISACESSVEVSSTAYEEGSSAYVGGLAGHNTAGAIITASAVRANVSLTNNYLTSTALGGFAGLNEGEISYSYAMGNVTGNASVEMYVGGFAGRNGGTISLSYFGTRFTPGAYSRLNTVSAVRAGGFVGDNSGNISQTYSVARVNASASAGGFAVNNTGSIMYSYSAGATTISVSAPSFIAGGSIPEGCFMYDYNGGTTGGTLDGLNNDTLGANGFGNADGFSTPLIEGMLYTSTFTETITAGSTPNIESTLVTKNGAFVISYDAENTSGYALTIYVTDGSSRFNRRGTAIVKYVIGNSAEEVISCSTTQVSI